ncbi:MFS transporter [Oculatella sp. LEGE 06141]|uniref:MFS transporter n=1 Tax=Oculatella sp. LEGE 06141 TaxID=1828648 RepID=UPI0018826BFB|nr:MFS transporter [Oculatella sp. LEGE 06141]
MRTFIILWLGQLASSIGSSMTYFALTLWVWQQTESATAIALILVFYQLPQIAISLFAGILVDRISRKHLLIVSDTAAAVCTLSVGILAAVQALQLWHIYLIAAIIGCFGNIQSLTYSTLVPLIVPKQHHTRASSLGMMVSYAAGILSPALAGLLYPRVGLLGITAIDMATFAIAMLTLFLVPIPQTRETLNASTEETSKKLWQETTFGFRYIAAQPSLLAMVIIMSSFAFLNQMGEVLYQPMILARTGGNAETLGIVVAASGVGGVVGAIALSIGGGFRRRTSGMIVGFIGIGLSELVLGLGRGIGIWAIARFGASLHSPLVFSSYMAVWYAKVAPNLQGRVFAADYLIGIVIEVSAGLSAGLLADRVFEPLMRSEGWLASTFGAMVGSGMGSGIALLYTLTAIVIIVIGLISTKVKRFQAAEALMPDHEMD